MMMEPIGFVKSGHRTPHEIEVACKEGLGYIDKSKIILNKNLVAGLDGIEEFSHMWVIFYLDREKRIQLKTYPGPSSITGLPDVGLYASRSPCRPNHIGLRLVKIISLNGRELVVEGLDAIDRTPVLDIKPFVPHFDLPEKGNVKAAGWYEW